MKKEQRRPAQKNINFRETQSERSATRSYRNFGPYLKDKINKLNKFVKI